MFRIICLIALVATAVATPRRHTLRSYHTGRIVNGTEAPPGKYPSQVSYQFFESHSCGGSILNENWVLTAAHCVGESTTFIYIQAGTVNLNRGGTRHAALELIKHEDFNADNLLNDVALVRVDPPFTWDENTRPVTLPAQGQETPGGLDATVIGWGALETGGSVTSKLQEVDYWTVSDQECMDAHVNYEVYPTNICAYYPGGGKGQCSGDSGGPLFVNGYQAGIVSWSEKPCAIAPFPGVFTEVSPYVDWINSKIN